MLKILQQFERPINVLTFSVETSFLPMEMDVFSESQKLILTSILNERCSIGISTDVKVQLIDIQERNMKKLTKLEDNLKFMINKISKEKYCKKAKAHTKERDLLKVSRNFFFRHFYFYLIQNIYYRFKILKNR